MQGGTAVDPNSRGFAQRSEGLCHFAIGQRPARQDEDGFRIAGLPGFGQRAECGFVCVWRRHDDKVCLVAAGQLHEFLERYLRSFPLTAQKKRAVDAGRVDACPRLRSVLGPFLAGSGKGNQQQQGKRTMPTSHGKRLPDKKDWGVPPVWRGARIPARTIPRFSRLPWPSWCLVIFF